MSTLDDAASAKAAARIPSPGNAAPTVKDSAYSWGCKAAIGAAVPLFIIIVLAILAATWIMREVIREELRETMLKGTQRQIDSP